MSDVVALPYDVIDATLQEQLYQASFRTTSSGSSFRTAKSRVTTPPRTGTAARLDSSGL